MTKKELIAVQSFLGSARLAVSEIKSYCRDFDSHTLMSTAEMLEEAVKELKKAAKI